jgi:hypothetical protein
MANQKGKFYLISSCIFLMVVMMLVLTSSVYAKTISVKQLGCDTPTDCYTTIGSAITYANQDDTIIVYPGRYEEAVVISKNLTLIGSGPQVTTIYSPSDGITVMANIIAKIIGFTITSSNYGINLKSNSQTIVRNNAIVSNGRDGVIVEYNKKVVSSIYNNIISYNVRNGINSNQSVSSCCVSNPLMNIANNIIFSNGNYGLNLFYADETISYNNVYSNLAGNYYSCSAGLGDISQNPQFIDSSNGNYALQSSSTSINAGTQGSADADPDGTRNDMGAYGGPDAAGFWPYPPGAPIITNLTISPTSVQKGGTITINATGEIR